MNHAEPQEWELLYVAAVLEPQPERRLTRIDEAKQAIELRVHQLTQEVYQTISSEKQAIEKALQTLQDLLRLNHKKQPRERRSL